MREKIRLMSEENTGYFYVTSKNKTNTKEKLRIKKYDPVLKKHIFFKEHKIT